MSDLHLRILTAAARQSQRELDKHDGAEAARAVGGKQRRTYLSERLTRTRSRVAAARARRGLAPRHPQSAGSGDGDP